ncbi:ABC transporter ATP-binding protein [Pseudoalteromonas luteoviolacea]|uniref:ABC transporter ATP-binding protein n=1 Tax=Pseudoalteromonas luteoviolacea S4054 TaxID=1129367 RepID=A0A0F6A8G5_9GAMM|nr:ABC transporter ATP-binding protein [Pseudoalteromonas luteoviolacea]AOT07659.1 ABC transporter ATP-binding protein [Pseudoalteromonas luteoviolacea]AOT12575.1 ABC transporter ATP-binding protein [Pseudoalteromonas luteoviolacea]AOT17489.1 ABC transporter ATP-binding protein [Pseudoalteromonas luteoviolacea]KKE82413.1 ABC transporter ATP-binding protein [Pseudoalteromonas luteoviolacea S4054]KZN66322.1 ABC transporter ATP-binding protein [Pseudoalteromonas luteoviolacea S4047-1]
MLEAINLKKSFSDKQVINDLSFKVDAGQIMCLLGANGAGKSTTLNIFLNFLQPDSGQALIDGIDVHSSAGSKEKLVYLPEQVNLYQEFNAIDNLKYLASLSDLPVTEAQINAALDETGLESSARTQSLKNYSKGMRQKVGIAFAIIRQAKVLLLDEPTSGLDPSATLEFIRIVEQLAQKGAAILMVTHDFYCAHTLADKIGIMDQGKLLTLLDNQQLPLNTLENTYHELISGKSVIREAS